jgi:hypothetical protein
LVRLSSRVYGKVVPIYNLRPEEMRKEEGAGCPTMARARLNCLSFLLLFLTTRLSVLVTGELVGLPSELGTRWAVLIAGSNGYQNYRHQVGKLAE